MTPFQIQTFPDDCSMVVTVSDDYVPRRDQGVLVTLLTKLVDSSTRRVTLIFDFTKLHLEMQDFLEATRESIRGNGAKLVKHKNVKASIIVSPSPIWHLTAKGFQSDAFGKLRVFAFNTTEEALTYVRENFCPPLPPPDEPKQDSPT